MRDTWQVCNEGDWMCRNAKNAKVMPFKMNGVFCSTTFPVYMALHCIVCGVYCQAAVNACGEQGMKPLQC